ncbi:hypothetical protein ACPV5S_15790 [Vibrio astriarenae]
MANIINMLEVDMTDIFDYDVHEDVEEWAWIEKNASFTHTDNGTTGVWEFIVWAGVAEVNPNDVPLRLRFAFEMATKLGVSFIQFHQGT